MGTPARISRCVKKGPMGAVALCSECGKKTYASKKAARSAARSLHPGEQMNAYRCGTGWHYGHLDRRVIAGELAKEDVYGVSS